jgi:hypothetical protein
LASRLPKNFLRQPIYGSAGTVAEAGANRLGELGGRIGPPGNVHAGFKVVALVTIHYFIRHQASVISQGAAAYKGLT